MYTGIVEVEIYLKKVREVLFYKKIAKVDVVEKNVNLEKIQQSIDFLLCGLVEYEFRTTVVNELHTTQDIESIAKWISGAEKYFLQNFVDSGDVICGTLSSVSTNRLHQMCAVSTNFVKKCQIR